MPPYPPRVVSLHEIAAARRAAQIPPTATVQLSPDAPWLPVDQVLARAGFVVGAPPTRLLLVGLLVVPPIWALVHQVAFKSGTVFLIVLWAACGAIAIAASSSASLRTKTSKELVAEVRGRPWLWRAMIATVAACEVLALGSAGLRAVRRSHADEAFSTKSDCDFVEKWDKLNAAELDTLDSEQVVRASARRAGCEEQRQKQAAEAYAKQCTQVAARLQSRTVSAEDRTLVLKGIPGGNEAYASGADGAELAARISGRSLKPSDLGGMKALPCGPATRRAYLEAVAGSPGAWGALSRADEIGDDVLEALGAEPKEKGRAAKPGEVTLSDESRAALHKAAEDAAKAKLSAKSASDTEVATGLCALERRLGNKPGRSCTSLVAHAARLKSAELAAQKTADARCKAAIAAKQRCMRACDAKQPHDELGMPAGDFDSSLECYERCEKPHASEGCD